MNFVSAIAPSSKEAEMSLFENDRYQWRETYFVFFDRERRPTWPRIQAALSKLHAHFEVSSPRLDADGEFESVTLTAPEAYSALDITYLQGEEVLEQGAQIVEEMRDFVTEPAEKAKLQRLPKYDAHFEIFHFEEIVPADELDEPEGMLDPGALLLVLGALAELTHGVAVDPQSNTLV